MAVFLQVDGESEGAPSGLRVPPRVRGLPGALQAAQSAHVALLDGVARRRGHASAQGPSRPLSRVRLRQNQDLRQEPQNGERDKV